MYTKILASQPRITRAPRRQQLSNPLSTSSASPPPPTNYEKHSPTYLQLFCGDRGSLQDPDDFEHSHQVDDLQGERCELDDLRTIEEGYGGHFRKRVRNSWGPSGSGLFGPWESNASSGRTNVGYGMQGSRPLPLSEVSPWQARIFKNHLLERVHVGI